MDRERVNITVWVLTGLATCFFSSLGLLLWMLNNVLAASTSWLVAIMSASISLYIRKKVIK